MRDYSFKITEKQYNYLLPIYGNSAPNKTQLLQRQNSYYFIGTNEDYKEVLNRCLYLND